MSAANAPIHLECIQEEVLYPSLSAHHRTDRIPTTAEEEGNEGWDAPGQQTLRLVDAASAAASDWEVENGFLVLFRFYLGGGGC